MVHLLDKELSPLRVLLCNLLELNRLSELAAERQVGLKEGKRTCKYNGTASIRRFLLATQKCKLF